MFEVDVASLSARASWLGRLRINTAEFYVVVGPDLRDQVADAVERALSVPANGGWRLISPVEVAADGAIFGIEPRSAWKQLAAQLAHSLSESGLEGSICAPPRMDDLPVLLSRPVPSPAVFARYRRRSPSDSDSSNYYDGGPGVWGVSPSISEAILDHAAFWSSRLGGAGQVSGAGIDVPASPDIVRQVIERRLPMAGSQRLDLTFITDASNPNTPARTVDFDSRGQVSYLDIQTQRSRSAVAEDLVEMMVSNADLLECAVLTAADYLGTRWTDLDVWWPSRAPNWDVLMPDAYPAQILTGAQLERTRDLGRWSVTDIAPDRWLVRKDDLSPWFDYDENDAWSINQGNQRFAESKPGRVARDEARLDFGDLIPPAGP